LLCFDWWCLLLYFLLFRCSYHNLQVLFFSYTKFHLGFKQCKFYEDIILYLFIFSALSAAYLKLSSFLRRWTCVLFIRMTSLWCFEKYHLLSLAY
jgi:hypothetical protein